MIMVHGDDKVGLLRSRETTEVPSYWNPAPSEVDLCGICRDLWFVLCMTCSDVRGCMRPWQLLLCLVSSGVVHRWLGSANMVESMRREFSAGSLYTGSLFWCTGALGGGSSGLGTLENIM